MARTTGACKEVTAHLAPNYGKVAEVERWESTSGDSQVQHPAQRGVR